MAEETLNIPPFPPLRWVDYFWVGEVGQADTSFLEWIAERDIKSDV